MDASLREIGGRCLLVTSPTAMTGRDPARRRGSRSRRRPTAVRWWSSTPTTPGANCPYWPVPPRSPGLTELVEKNGSLGRGDDGGPAAQGGATCCAAGKAVPNPAAFYRSGPLPRHAGRLRRCADLVLVVGPPVLEGADASVLADSVDAVLLVVPETATDDELREAAARLSWSMAGLLGYFVVEPAARPRPTGSRLHRLVPRRAGREPARPPAAPIRRPPQAAGGAAAAGRRPAPNGRLPTAAYLPPVDKDTGS